MKEQDHVLLDLIKQLTLASGPSGFESEVTGILDEELASLSDTVCRDGIGNRVYVFEPTLEADDQEGTLLFAAHQDEIGFMVHSILPSGFLRIQPLGGWNPVTLPSSPVAVHTRSGSQIEGVIGHISPHFLKDRKGGIPEIQELFIDVGASSRGTVEKELGIHIGDPVVPVTRLSWNPLTRTIVSKAFDDRIGIAALILLGKRLAKQERKNRILLAATVQEEVGARGAAVLAHRLTSGELQADGLIIVEGAPADDIPGGPEISQTAVGRGVHLRLFDPTMIGSPKLIELIRRRAESGNLSVQETVRRGGGTDGGILHLTGLGIPSAVTGVPVRYAHSHNCLISLDDVTALTELLESVCAANLLELKI